MISETVLTAGTMRSMAHFWHCLLYTSILGVKDIVVARSGKNKGAQTEKPDFDMEKGLIVGNIRMGFGHYSCLLYTSRCV